jgi:hypothetical protein
MEPDYALANILGFSAPFVCYYIGIVIRKVALPGKASLPLGHQLLLGIPVSLVVVSPLLPVIAATYSNVPALLVTLGIVIEHGMLVNETATTHLKKLTSGTGA